MGTGPLRLTSAAPAREMRAGSTVLPIHTTRVILATAHLDHDPTHNSGANLATLCQRCHILHDAKEHRRRRWYTIRARRALGDLFDGPYWQV